VFPFNRKQGDALSPLFFIFALEYASRKVQVNEDSLKLNGAHTHQHLFYADIDYILGRNVHTLKKNTEALVVASKENGLEVNGDNK
jgi:hypothetical protein